MESSHILGFMAENHVWSKNPTASNAGSTCCSGVLPRSAAISSGDLAVPS